MASPHDNTVPAGLIPPPSIQRTARFVARTLYTHSDPAARPETSLMRPISSRAAWGEHFGSGGWLSRAVQRRWESRPTAASPALLRSHAWGRFGERERPFLDMTLSRPAIPLVSFLGAAPSQPEVAAPQLLSLPRFSPQPLSSPKARPAARALQRSALTIPPQKGTPTQGAWSPRSPLIFRSPLSDEPGQTSPEQGAPAKPDLGQPTFFAPALPLPDRHYFPAAHTGASVANRLAETRPPSIVRREMLPARKPLRRQAASSRPMPPTVNRLAAPANVPGNAEPSRPTEGPALYLAHAAAPDAGMVAHTPLRMDGRVVPSLHEPFSLPQRPVLPTSVQRVNVATATPAVRSARDAGTSAPTSEPPQAAPAVTIAPRTPFRPVAALAETPSLARSLARDALAVSDGRPRSAFLARATVRSQAAAFPSLQLPKPSHPSRFPVRVIQPEGGTPTVGRTVAARSAAITTGLSEPDGSEPPVAARAPVPSRSSIALVKPLAMQRMSATLSRLPDAQQSSAAESGAPGEPTRTFAAVSSRTVSSPMALALSRRIGNASTEEAYDNAAASREVSKSILPVVSPSQPTIVHSEISPLSARLARRSETGEPPAPRRPARPGVTTLNTLVTSRAPRTPRQPIARAASQNVISREGWAAPSGIPNTQPSAERIPASVVHRAQPADFLSEGLRGRYRFLNLAAAPTSISRDAAPSPDNRTPRTVRAPASELGGPLMGIGTEIQRTPVLFRAVPSLSLRKLITTARTSVPVEALGPSLRQEYSPSVLRRQIDRFSSPAFPSAMPVERHIVTPPIAGENSRPTAVPTVYRTAQPGGSNTQSPFAAVSVPRVARPFVGALVPLLRQAISSGGGPPQTKPSFLAPDLSRSSSAPSPILNRLRAGTSVPCLNAFAIPAEPPVPGRTATAGTTAMAAAVLPRIASDLGVSSESAVHRVPSAPLAPRSASTPFMPVLAQPPAAVFVTDRPVRAVGTVSRLGYAVRAASTTPLPSFHPIAERAPHLNLSPGGPVSRDVEKTSVVARTPDETAAEAGTPTAAPQERPPGGGGTEHGDINLLASEVWSLLKRRLAVEAERMGRW